MRKIHIRLDLSATPLQVIVSLAVMLLLGTAEELVSENVTLTTYYPAPSGIYTQMIVTGKTLLARDAGSMVGIGTTAPLSPLSVNGGVAIGNYSTANAAPSGNGGGLIVSGNVGIGTSSPGGALDVEGAGGAILNAGNVGVGTSAPGSLLEVAGTIHSTQDCIQTLYTMVGNTPCSTGYYATMITGIYSPNQMYSGPAGSSMNGVMYCCPR